MLIESEIRKHAKACEEAQTKAVARAHLMRCELGAVEGVKDPKGLDAAYHYAVEAVQCLEEARRQRAAQEALEQQAMWQRSETEKPSRADGAGG